MWHCCNRRWWNISRLVFFIYINKKKKKNHTLSTLFRRSLHLVSSGVLRHKVISHLIIWCCFLSVSSWRLRVPQSAGCEASEEAWCLIPPLTAVEVHARDRAARAESQTWRSRAGWTASDWVRGRGARTGDGSPCWTRPRSSSGPAMWRAKASSPAQIWGLEEENCVCVVKMCVLDLSGAEWLLLKVQSVNYLSCELERYWWRDFKAATWDYFLKE